MNVNGKYLAQKATGVQRYARNIVRCLDDLLREQQFSNFEVALLAPADMERKPALQAIQVRKTGGRAGPVWEQLHLGAFGSPLLLCLGNTGPILNRNKVTCIHDLHVRMLPDSYSRKFRLYYNTMIPLVAATSRVVVTVSEFSKRVLVEHRIANATRIRVIPNGHEHVFEWRPEHAMFAPDALCGRPFFVLVGSHAAHKNLAVVGAVASRIRVRGVEIVVAGGSGSEFARHNLPGAEHFHFLGVITDNDLAWLYENALGLLFPSRLEGFGLPVVEAMALGCPVVSSTAACLPDIGGDAVLYAPPDEPDAWLAAAERLIDGREIRWELIRRGRERVKLFSWRRSAELYLDLLRDLA